LSDERRDDLEVEALVTDHYIDSLLAARDRRAKRPESVEAPAAEVRLSADRLSAELPRVHPSFRFEERLATELQGRAARLRLGNRPPRPNPIRRLEPPTVLRARPALFDDRLSPAPVPRPLLIGGALTSAALSLAGAYVAWRRGRGGVDPNPMVRAVRAAHRTGIVRRRAGARVR
jgi:hypothetical protein